MNFITIGLLLREAFDRLCVRLNMYLVSIYIYILPIIFRGYYTAVFMSASISGPSEGNYPMRSRGQLTTHFLVNHGPKDNLVPPYDDADDDTTECSALC